MLVVFGAHLIVHSNDADSDRAFLSEVFGFESVDAGGGWLIFALPPAEVAVHPAETPGAELYLMSDDLSAEMRSLADGEADRTRLRIETTAPGLRRRPARRTATARHEAPDRRLRAALRRRGRC
jgi:hypothetical protein